MDPQIRLILVFQMDTLRLKKILKKNSNNILKENRDFNLKNALCKTNRK